MKWVKVPALVLLISLTAMLSIAYAKPVKEKPAIDKATTEEQISYALGYDIFLKLSQVIEMSPEYFFLGAQDGLKGKPRMTQEQIAQSLMLYQKIAQQKHRERIAEESRENLEAGMKFLDENKKKEGVITLSSGLQYKVLKEGTGPKPKLDDRVECHYTGTLIDGTEFDSSYRRGNPAVFQVNQVIPGWIEALQKMPVGSKWMLFIPSDLGYGNRGAGPQIKPGSALVFEVELISIME